MNICAEYNKYMSKVNILGEKAELTIEYNKNRDICILTQISIDKLLEQNENSDDIIIDIPEFVTEISNNGSVFNGNKGLLNNKNITVNWESFIGKSLRREFENFKCKKLELNINLENVESTSGMFCCTEIDEIKFINTNSKMLKNIEKMFATSTINKMNFEDLDLSKVTNMESTFSLSKIYCKLKLKNLINATNMFNTFYSSYIEYIDTSEIMLKKIEILDGTFSYFSTLSEKLDLSSCDFSRLRIAEMTFSATDGIYEVSFGNIERLDRLETIDYMFYETSIESIDIDCKTISAKHIQSMDKAFDSKTKAREWFKNITKIDIPQSLKLEMDKSWKKSIYNAININ